MRATPPSISPWRCPSDPVSAPGVNGCSLLGTLCVRGGVLRSHHGRAAAIGWPGCRTAVPQVEVSVAQQVATTDAQQRAGAAWRALGARIRTVTPAGVGRIVVVTFTVLALAALLGVTWPAIVPFLAGGVLAYAVLPVVDRLDRYMPRAVAGLLAVVAVVAAVIAFLVVVGPPILAQLVKIFLELPTGDRLADVGVRVRDWLATLPDGSRTIATEVIERVVTILKADINGVVDGLAKLIADSIIHTFDALSVVLGLLVIPTWILSVTRDTPPARRRLSRHIAPWLRPDLLALARIVDAVASAYLRVQLLASVGTGLGVWLALYAAGRFGLIPEAPYIAVSAIAGAAQLIPQVGPILGALPALVLLATQPPEIALAFVVSYVVVLKVAGMLVGGRLSGPALDVHPAILIPGVVVASQIGIIPLLVAGPLIAVAVHAVQYVYGRFAEPPRPPGLLPWQPLPPPVGTARARSGPRVPLVYRRAAAERRSPVAGVGPVVAAAPASSATPGPASAPAPVAPLATAIPPVRPEEMTAHG